MRQHQVRVLAGQDWWLGLAEEPAIALCGWGPELETGIATVDQQHQALFNLLQQLQDAMMQTQAKPIRGALFDLFFRYLVNHCDHEIGLLARYGFVGLEGHKQEHDRYILTLKEVGRQFSQTRYRANGRAILVLGDWLRHHVQGVDRGYSEFLLAGGKAELGASLLCPSHCIA